MVGVLPSTNDQPFDAHNPLAAQLRGLLEEKDRLTSNQPTCSVPPQIDTATVRPYLSRIEKVLAKGQAVEVKKLLKTCVEEIVLEPEECQVTINYTTPEMSSPELSLSLVAGAGFEPATFGL